MDLIGLGPVGVVAALALLLQTVIAAYFAQRSRHYGAAYRWRRHIEPRHLDALDWIFTVQQQAIREGRRDQLPPLPESLLTDDWEDDPPWDIRLRRRRRDRERR